MTQLTQERLKELIHYDGETGVFTRLVGLGKRPELKGTHPGFLNRQGYVMLPVDSKTYRAHRLAWLYAHGRFPKEAIDHINAVKNDNRLCNLREATKQQNERAKGLRCNNTSGTTGVYWSRAAKKWQAFIKVDQQVRYLGIYEDKNLAVSARHAAEKTLFGEFAGGIR